MSRPLAIADTYTFPGGVTVTATAAPALIAGKYVIFLRQSESTKPEDADLQVYEFALEVLKQSVRTVNGEAVSEDGVVKAIEDCLTMIEVSELASKLVFKRLAPQVKKELEGELGK